MSLQSMFPAAEWRTLQFAPLWVFVGVAAADGKIDKKELEVLAKELSEAHLYKDPLAREVLLSVGGDFENIFRQFGLDKRTAVDGLSQAADTLDRRLAPAAAYEFKRAMLTIGYNVSESSGAGFLGMGKKAIEAKHRALDGAAILLRFSMGAPAPAAAPARPPAAAAPPVGGGRRPAVAPPVAAAPPSKRISLYMVIDSSRAISDIAYLLDSGLRRIPEKMSARPARGVAAHMALILADNTGRIATPLTEAAQFASASLLGRGECKLGAALANLLADLRAHPVEGKPLVVLVLGGPPSDSWTSQADELARLAASGKANVFVFGVGGYDDPAVLKRLTPMQPLVMDDVTAPNTQAAFDWLYAITDTILSGMEAGASGQRRSVPAPPACLRKI